MKRSLSIFVLCLILAPIPSAGEKLTILTEDWAPFNYMKNGNIIGIGTEFVKAIMEQAGLEYELKIQPWKRAYRTTQERQNTLLYTTSRTAQRENLFQWVGPLFPRQILLYKLKTRLDIVNKLQTAFQKLEKKGFRAQIVKKYLKSITQ